MLTSSALAHFKGLLLLHRYSKIPGFLTLAQFVCSLLRMLLHTIHNLFEKKFGLVVGRRGQSNYRDSGDGAKSERDPRHVPAGLSTCGRGGYRLELHLLGIDEVPNEVMNSGRRVKKSAGGWAGGASCVEWEQVRSAA